MIQSEALYPVRKLVNILENYAKSHALRICFMDTQLHKRIYINLPVDWEAFACQLIPDTEPLCLRVRLETLLLV